jgi:glycosyltransferase involved in cell wall biosynthesis
MLTIAIPTYNRNAILARTVEALRLQVTPRCRLVIVDNSSDLPVAESLGALAESVNGCDVQVVRNRTNVGANANILRCFELCETEWLWVLGDDDTVQPDAIQTIFRHIDAHPDATFFNFAVEHHRQRRAVKVTKGLAEFVSNFDSFGNLIFISTNIYRAPAMRTQLRIGHQYAYSMAPQLATLLSVLGEDGICHLCTDVIVSYTPPPPDQQWPFITFCLGAPALLEMPLPPAIWKQFVRVYGSQTGGEAIPSRILFYRLLAMSDEAHTSGYVLYLYDQICMRWFYFDRRIQKRLSLALYRLMLRFPHLSRRSLTAMFKLLGKKNALIIERGHDRV